jgi:hypothetical protein
MEKKITKREMFTRLLEIVKGDEVMTAFINHEIELLDRKKSGTKPTKAQAENIALMDTLYEELRAIDKAVTITEFQKLGGKAAELSNQKISALFKLMDGTRVEKTVEKGKSYFKAI